MSLRTEVQELVQWLADMADEPGSSDPPAPTKDSWEAAERALKRAATWLAQAESGTESLDESGVLTEIAQDLRRETEDAKERARVLKLRAVPAAEETDEAPGGDGRLDAGDAEVEVEVEKPPADALPEKPVVPAERKAKPKSKPKQLSAATLVSKAQLAIETARRNLTSSGKTDEATEGFAEELDVLAEMALSLGHRIRRANEAKAGQVSKQP